jgi:hypothetical protein
MSWAGGGGKLDGVHALGESPSVPCSGPKAPAAPLMIHQQPTFMYTQGPCCPMMQQPTCTCMHSSPLRPLVDTGHHAQRTGWCLFFVMHS